MLRLLFSRGPLAVLVMALLLVGHDVARSQERSQVHVVRRGDSLSTIALRYRLSLAELRALNPALEDPNEIQAGERVRVCCALSDAAPASPQRARARAASEPLAALLRTPEHQRRWSAIVIHHTAGASGDLAGIEHFHREVRGFPRGMAYHLVIGNGHGMGDGEIGVGGRWRQQQPGAHVASHRRDPQTHELVDDIAIGIALIGNFENGRPSAAQDAALHRLVGYLRARYGIPADRVFGHGEVRRYR